jgi:glycerate dehydrogenase
MRIVVLDALPLNPGDLDWGPLAEMGQLALHDGTPPASVDERIADAQIVFTNKVRLGEANFAAAKGLRLVSVLATGYDVVDLEAAARHGVTVCNVPAYSTDSVAQVTIALLLELTHAAGRHSDSVHAGQWSRSETFGYWLQPLTELAGKIMGIIGLGNIGRRVAAIAYAMGMEVWGYDVVEEPVPETVIPAGDGEILAAADVVSLHCPLTEQTRHRINAETLATMKPTAILLNAARGPLVDEAAVAAALREGRLGGYGADVMSIEPPAADNPLLGAPRCVLTPHLAWASTEARRRLMQVSIENARAFVAGTPQNVVR